MRTRKTKKQDEAAELIDELLAQNEKLRAHLASRTHVEPLQNCPICGRPVRLEETGQDFIAVCSEDCPAPDFPHTHPRDTSVSWNDWVRWYRADGTLRRLIIFKKD